MSRAPLLVSGASGFLGRHLLGALAAQPEPRRALALVRDEASWRAQDWTAKLGDVELVTGTLADAERLAADPRLAALGGIVHLAAVVQHSRRDAEAGERVNVEGTLAMVRLAAARRCRVVFVSTSGTVGCFASGSESADESAPFCEATVAGWPYYRSKIRAEREARRLAQELGADLVIVRPPILLGPGDHKLRSTSNLLRFLRGRLPFLVRGGIAFADVRDVTQALVRIADLERPQPLYHLPGTAWSIEEFFRQAGAIAGRPAPRFVLPYGVARPLAGLTARLGLHVFPDPVVVEMASHYWGVRSLHAERDLGFRSRPPADTLRDTIEWLRENALPVSS